MTLTVHFNTCTLFLSTILYYTYHATQQESRFFSEITLTAALFEWKLTKRSCTQILVMTHDYDNTISCALYIYYKTKKEPPCDTRDTRSQSFEVGKLFENLFQHPLRHWYGCSTNRYILYWHKATIFVRIQWLRPSKYYKLTLTSSFKLSHHNLERAHLDGWWVWLMWTSCSSCVVCTMSLHPDPF